jgi:hypothetical protein
MYQHMLIDAPRLARLFGRPRLWASRRIAAGRYGPVSERWTQIAARADAWPNGGTGKVRFLWKRTKNARGDYFG